MQSVQRRHLAPPRLYHITIILLLLTLLPAAAVAREPMLAQRYTEQLDVDGWLMSEKLDGVRGYWDGRQLFSKNGNLLHPPNEFTSGLPPFPLEGELWGGRQRFEQTVSTVKRQQPHVGWLQLKFAIFDVPHAPGGFTARIARARDWLNRHPTPFAFIIPQLTVTDEAQMLTKLRQIEKIGGEGLIVRQPDALYTAGRSMKILKVKSHQDAEATVLAHLPGKGRNEGRLGSLLVELADGTRFKVGSGFSDHERQVPPPIGAIITFRYFGTYQSGTPKFPSFLRVRYDHDI
jgi:DNA ligase-1